MIVAIRARLLMKRVALRHVAAGRALPLRGARKVELLAIAGRSAEHVGLEVPITPQAVSAVFGRESHRRVPAGICRDGEDGAIFPQKEGDGHVGIVGGDDEGTCT